MSRSRRHDTVQVNRAFADRPFIDLDPNPAHDTWTVAGRRRHPLASPVIVSGEGTTPINSRRAAGTTRFADGRRRRRKQQHGLGHAHCRFGAGTGAVAAAFNPAGVVFATP